MKNVKRLAVFSFFDKDGIVDEYVCYLLEQLSHITERIIVVSNGVISDVGKDKFAHFTQEIIERENSGYDVAAWKQILTQYIQHEELCTYDELILINDTFYGPFYPIENIFDIMYHTQQDFWGLMAHAEETIGIKKFPWHIQSYFMVFHHNVISSPAFIDYWRQVPIFKNVIDVVDKHERVFTSYLQAHGFVGNVLVDTDDWDKQEKNGSIHYFYSPYNLVAEKNYPVVKRKLFVWERGGFLDQNDGGDLRRLFEYIDQKTDYDVKNILENILRLYPMETIIENLNQYYIVTTNPSNRGKLTDIAFVIIGDSEKANYFYNHAVKWGGDVYYAKETSCKNLLEKNYRYIGVINESLRDVCANYATERTAWEYIENSIIASGEYILEVKKTFEMRSYLNLLVAEIPLCGKLFSAKLQNVFDNNSFWVKLEGNETEEFYQELVQGNVEYLIQHVKEKNQLYGYLLNQNIAERVLATQNYIIKKGRRYAFLNGHIKTFSYQQNFLCNEMFSGISISKVFGIVTRHLRSKIK